MSSLSQPGDPARGPCSVGRFDRQAHAFAKLRDANRLTVANLAVAQWLCMFADDDGHAWPSASTIAGLCGFDTRSVRRALADLESVGILVRAGTATRGVVRWSVVPSAVPGEMAKARIRRPTPPVAHDDAVGPRTGESYVAHDLGPVSPRTGESTPDSRVRPPRTDGSPEEYMEEVHPPTPQGGPGSAPRTTEPAPATAGHPQRQPNPDDFTGLEPDAVLANQVFDRLKRLGKIDREFAVKAVCVRFVQAGGGMPDLEALIGESSRAQADGSYRMGGGKIGILVHWLEDPIRWRSVVGDAGERGKLSQIRKTANALSTPTRLAEMVGAS